MQTNIKSVLKSARQNLEFFIAISLVVSLFFLISFIWGYLDLPSAVQMVDYVNNFFLKYGLIVVFFAALVESIILLGAYFPGTIIIFLSLSITAGHFGRMLETVLMASLGMLIGYTIDYILGRYGVSRILTKLHLDKDINKLQNQIQKSGIKSVFLFYLLPGFGAITSVALGVIKYDFKKLIPFVICSVLIWNTLWGFVGYFFGSALSKVVSSGYLGLIILFVWFSYFVFSGKYAEFKKAYR